MYIARQTITEAGKPEPTPRGAIAKKNSGTYSGNQKDKGQIKVNNTPQGNILLN